jgi:hypothetical protein
VNPVPKLEEEEGVPVPDGPGEEQITEGLTACSFLIKAIFASSPAVVGLDILVISIFFTIDNEQN